MTAPRTQPRINDRLGVATIPLAGGLALATYQDRDLQHDVARLLAPGHPRMLTVALSTQDGGFVIGQLADDHRSVIETVHDGVELAAALSGLPLYGRDLRLWLGWPSDPAERRALSGQFDALASTSGATVWTPAVGATAVLLTGCRDLAAAAPGGRPARWRPHRPAGVHELRFDSDVDGRLVPVGGPVVRRVGGVTLLGTPPREDAAVADRYRALWSRPGLCNVDLAVLDDGRLALAYADGTLLAAGPCGLRHHLEAAGWAGEDLCLLSSLTLPQAAGVEDHLHSLVRELGVDAYFRTPDARLSIQDGHARVLWPDQRPGEWHRVTPPGIARQPARWCSDDGWLEPAGESAPAVQPSPAARRAVAGPEPDVAVVVPAPVASISPGPPAPAPRLRPGPTPALSRPTPGSPASQARARDRPSGLPWLPVSPPVNAGPLWLTVSSRAAPEQVRSEGLPTDELFLLGDVDDNFQQPAGPASPEGPPRLRLLVQPGAAVVAALVSDAAPARIRALLRGPWTYLVPAGWLDQTRLVIDDPTRPPSPLVLRCTAGAHGIDGLPNDVVAWPRSRPRRAFALYPVRAGRPVEGDEPAEADGSVRLYRRRPAVAAGFLLLELRLDRATAIDIPASAADLAGLPLVRSRIGELHARGVDLLLPLSVTDQVMVLRTFLADNDVWRPVPDLVGHSGADVFGTPARAGHASSSRTAAASSARD